MRGGVCVAHASSDVMNRRKEMVEKRQCTRKETQRRARGDQGLLWFHGCVVACRGNERSMRAQREMARVKGQATRCTHRNRTDNRRKLEKRTDNDSKQPSQGTNALSSCHCQTTKQLVLLSLTCFVSIALPAQTLNLESQSTLTLRNKAEKKRNGGQLTTSAG